MLRGVTMEFSENHFVEDEEHNFIIVFNMEVSRVSNLHKTNPAIVYGKSTELVQRCGTDSMFMGLDVMPENLYLNQRAIIEEHELLSSPFFLLLDHQRRLSEETE